MKDINDFKNKIKDQDELLSLDEVKGMLAEPPTGFFAAKWKQIGTLAIAVLGTLTALFWLWPSDNQKVNLASNTPTTEQVQDSIIVSTEHENIIKNDASIEDNHKIVGEIAKTPTPQNVKPNFGRISSDQAADRVATNKLVSTQSEQVNKEDMTEVLKAIANGEKPNIAKDVQVRTDKNKLESDNWRTLADSLGAIYLSDEQLEKFDLHKYDDVLLFSKTDNKNRYQVCLTESGRNQYSLSGLSQQWKEEQPALVISQNDIHYGSRNLDNVQSQADKYFIILVPFKIRSDDYTLWYFKKNKATIQKLPKDILVKNFNANNILSYSDKTDSKNKNRAIAKEVSSKEYEVGQVILPNKDLLSKLRITLDDEGIFYQSKGQIGDNNSISLKGYFTESSYGNMKVLPQSSDFAPSFFTQKRIPILPISVTEFHSPNKRKLNSEQYFYAHKQEMIALPLLKPDSTEVVFWYEDTASILNLLTPQESIKIREYLAASNGLNLNIVSKENNEDKALINMMQEFKELKALSINPVILNDKSLLNLGIENDGKQITLYRPGGKMTLTKRRTYHSFTLPDSDKGKIASVSPLHISDKFGKGYRMKTVTIDSNQNLDRLIPIYIGTNEKYRLSDYFDNHFHPDCIFWYEPTKEFLALLPTDIREQLEYELTLIPNATEVENPQTDSLKSDETLEAKSCVYLDPCSDIKTNLKGVKLYPNPTNAKVTLKISANDAVKGAVTVNNLAGQEMKSVSLDDIRLGTTLDLSELPTGIYLVTLLTNDGDKITRRVIKE